MKLWDLYEGKDYKINPTLDRILKARDYVKNPEKQYKSIIVGGTNGKGSTCAFLNYLLVEHGLKTGWFVSPHLVRENERLRVNNILISDEELEYYVKDLKPVFEKFELTYFEAITLIGLLYFKDKNVDIVVWEVGMGGRWDGTRASKPFLGVLTNIGKDHMKWLGNTVDKIAAEKLEIANGTKTFLIGNNRYPLYPMAVEKAKEQNTKLFVAGEDFEYKGYIEKHSTYIEEFSFFDFHIKNLKLGLWGKHQIDNGALALASFLTIPSIEPLFKPKEEFIKKALEKTYWEGRMEILREKPLIMVDGAHNVSALVKIIKDVKEHLNNIRLVMGSLKDKEWQKELDILRAYFDEITFVPIHYKRAEDINIMVDYAKSIGFKTYTLEDAKDILSLKEDVFVFGSLYLLGELKRAIEKS
ncbi:MAG: bifunctional folylpolyglutamate synthase/dihydrofolate synthase [Hydrogenobaculum sp.]|nr:MAG: bifunctional folylpolyglutamate synthase/dihydrofolate synthase [Hydrogenobaculum sp.]